MDQLRRRYINIRQEVSWIDAEDARRQRAGHVTAALSLHREGPSAGGCK